MTFQVLIATAITSDEFAAVRPLVQAHVAYERSDVAIPADWEEGTAQLAAAGKLTLLFARVGREAVGYASVTTDVATWTGETFVHLDCLFVAESHRGAGIGRLLVDAAVEETRLRGHRELQWQTPEWNSGAIRFYEGLGARSDTKKRFTLTLR